jgi:hypothetical protein
MSAIRILTRLGIAAGLALTGYLHADLYAHGYRGLHVIGPSFLWLAGASFALATLFAAAVAVPEPALLRLAAASLAAGALAGFVLSRTVGLFGFVERGLQPAPQALLSLVAESAVLVLAGGGLLADARRTRDAWRGRDARRSRYAGVSGR